MGKRSRQDLADDDEDDRGPTKRSKHQPIPIIKVYVDGSFWKRRGCRRPKKVRCNCTRRAGYGVYLPERIKKRKTYSGRAPMEVITSGQAEFHAITVAIKFFRTENAKLNIFTDYLHAVKISKEYNDWLQEENEREEYIEKMFEGMRSCNHLPQLFHVRGHSGIEGNEMADGLAKQGMRKGCGGQCV